MNGMLKKASAVIAIVLASCTVTKQSCFTPTLSSINFIDQQGVSETINNNDRLKQFEMVDFFSPQPYKKVMRVYSRDQKGSIHAYLTSYHSNSEIHQYLEIVDGRASGQYREWHPNGQLKIEATVLSGIADLTIAAEKSWLFSGCSRAWDEKGQLQAEIPYIKGVQEGSALYYHPNGAIARQIPYRQGGIDGICQLFHDNGELFLTSKYLHGKREGATQQRWDNGSLAADEWYESGKLLTGKYTDIDGTVISTIEDGNGFRALFDEQSLLELQEYRGGRQEGVVKVFNNFGQLKKQYNVQNNCKQGEEVEYYPSTEAKTPKPQLSLNWLDGKLHGMIKTWYPNGQQQSAREMANNRKNGLLTAWYNNGSLMLLEEYSDDKLIKGEYYKRGESYPISTIVDGKGKATLFDDQGLLLHQINYRFGKPELDDN